MVCQTKQKLEKIRSLKVWKAKMRVSLLLLLLDSSAALALSVCCNCHCSTHPTQTDCTFPRSPLSLSLSSIAAVTSSTGKYLQQFNCSQFCLFLTGLWLASFSCVCAPASSRICSTPLSSCCSTSWYWLFCRIPSALLLLLHLVLFQSSVLEYICKEEIGLLTRISLFLGIGGEGVHCKMLFTRMHPGIMT